MHCDFQCGKDGAKVRLTCIWALILVDLFLHLFSASTFFGRLNEVWEKEFLLFSRVAFTVYGWYLCYRKKKEHLELRIQLQLYHGVLMLRCFCGFFYFFSFCYFMYGEVMETVTGFSTEAGTTFVNQTLGNQDVVGYLDHNIRMILTYWWIREILFVGTT